MSFIRRTWAEVDLDCIRENYEAIRSYIRPGCKIMSVVKADAYGHGVPYVAKELDLAGTDYFAVSNIDEAVQLRRCGIGKPILILGYTPPEYAETLIRNEITQTVFSLDYAAELSKAAEKAGGTIKVHIKIDTGMGRIGFLCNGNCDMKAFVNDIMKAKEFGNLDFEGIFTHFSVSDEPEKPFTKKQFDCFMQAIEILEQNGLKFKIRHCCNSAGLMFFPEMQLDMVRPGIILYGLLPSAGMPVPIKLSSAMSLKTVISEIKTLEKDMPVSYGMKYVTKQKTVIATLPVGYADGFVRSLSNSAEVLIAGKRAKIIGRVCMDQCMADVTDIPEAKRDGTVTIIGTDGQDAVTMDEIAARMGTINYETACLIGKRVPRVFYKGGKNVGMQNYFYPEA